MIPLTIISCGSSEKSNSDHYTDTPVLATPGNQFTVPDQAIASDLVHSVTLNRRDDSPSAPIFRLNSPQQLRLSFDLLESNARQLRISFTHHNPDWSRSGLAVDFYKDGLYNLHLPFGELSRAQQPYYRRYTYDFPNNNIAFLVSGNYMLQVENADSGELLFSLPFFITENEGVVRSQVESRIVPRVDRRISHRPRSIFEIPNYVTTPQFDLEFYYVQNQFWGRAIKAEELDTSTEGQVLFEMRQEFSFIGDYEFQFLSLSELSQQTPRVLEYRPTEIPPRIELFDDVQGFSAARSPVPRSNLNNPQTELSARYANVHFRFNPDERISRNSNIYLVGDFNNWSIHSAYRLNYHSETDRWRTNGFIKTGTYAYKYVLVEGNTIYDLALDDAFTRSQQEYHAFVYYRDTERFYYRLLQTNNFFETP